MPTPTPLSLIDARTLEKWLYDAKEIALIDIREEGLFGEGHALFAANLPYSRLELEIGRAVPRLDTRIVLIAEDETLPLAIRHLEALGYRNVHALTGGVQAWQDAGHALYPSIFVPSKAFAEVVEHEFHTPAIEAEDLNKLLQDGADVIVLDSRTTEEYTRFHVPGAISVPSAELVYRFDDLVTSPDTFVVISCAGRTRGIIGAQALINAGVPNRVAALAGGTQGWKLANLTIETGRTKVYGPVSAASVEKAQQRAGILAQRFGIQTIDLDTLSAWQADQERTTYLLDVRPADEYAAGHLPGAISIAGGQLVQSLDRWATTRGARIVLADDAKVRAIVTAHWVHQLGWEVYVLPFHAADTQDSRLAQPQPSLQQGDAIARITPATAKTWLEEGASAISVAGSANYRQSHAAGTIWSNRSRLGTLPAATLQSKKFIVFADNPQEGALAALDLHRRTGNQSVLVEGDLAAWRDAGLPVESTPDVPTDSQRVDHLFWLYDRHTGNAKSSRAYLDWELSLPAAIGSPEKAGFRFPRKPA